MCHQTTLSASPKNLLKLEFHSELEIILHPETKFKQQRLREVDQHPKSNLALLKGKAIPVLEIPNYAAHKDDNAFGPEHRWKLQCLTPIKRGTKDESIHGCNPIILSQRDRGFAEPPRAST